MTYIFIDSSKRAAKQNTNSNNIHILFNNNVIIKKYIKLLHCIIPKTCYLINEKNNSFIIKFSDNTTFNITIPINNYDVNTLAATIKTLINYSNFNIVFDENKFNYTLSANQNFLIEFNSKFYKLLNFENIIYNSNNNILYSNVINFNNPMHIQIDINNIESSYISHDNLNANFIIPFNVERFGILYYSTLNSYPQINFVNREYKLNFFNIVLYDTDGDLLDINNSDYYLLFEYE